MYLLSADELLIFDRGAQTVTILVNAIIENGVSAADAYEDAIGEIDRLLALLEQPLQEPPVTVPSNAPNLPFTSNVAQEKYFANVEHGPRLFPRYWI